MILFQTSLKPVFTREVSETILIRNFRGYSLMNTKYKYRHFLNPEIRTDNTINKTKQTKRQTDWRDTAKKKRPRLTEDLNGNVDNLSNTVQQEDEFSQEETRRILEDMESPIQIFKNHAMAGMKSSRGKT